MTAPISAAGAVQAPLTATADAAATKAQQQGAAGKTTETSKQGEAFERMLVGQLTKTLIDSALPEDATSAATAAYKDMLPDALTEALMSGGGIGLAKSLEEGIK